MDDDGFGTTGYEEFLKDPKDEILKQSQHLEGECCYFALSHHCRDCCDSPEVNFQKEYLKIDVFPDEVVEDAFQKKFLDAFF